jgi:hypothetical protein
MTTFICNFFYFLIPIFIWVEIFGFLNRDKVFRRLKFEEIESYNPKLYLFFYFSKLTYIISMIVGIFTSLYFYFILLLSLGFGRFLILKTRRNVMVNLYDFLNPLFSVIILIIILFLKLSQLL